jgi:hypothetical protein
MGGHLAEAGKAVGREDLKWHDLRHTGAIMGAEAGATTAEFQAFALEEGIYPFAFDLSADDLESCATGCGV